MEKMKKNYVVYGILLVVIVLLFAALILIVNDKDKNNAKGKEFDEKTYVREIVCSRKNSTQIEEYETTLEFVLKADITGEITSYSNRYIDKYKSEYKKAYETIKDAELTGLNYKFDDDKLQVTKTVEYNMTGEDGKKTSIWYKDYVNNLKNDGYKCVEK